jgi:hypothetical protein
MLGVVRTLAPIAGLLAGLFPSEWLHPGGSGYWFYSGIFDAGIMIAILSSVGVYWRTHNCHVRGCWRLDWHPHPEHDHPVCRSHHPHGGADFLHARHHRAKASVAASSAARSSVTTEAAESARAHPPQPDRGSSNGSAGAARSDREATKARCVNDNR